MGQVASALENKIIGKRKAFLNQKATLSLHSLSRKNFRSFSPLSRVAFSFFSHPPLLANKAPTFGHHFCSKSREEGIFRVVKRISTCGTLKFQVG